MCFISLSRGLTIEIPDRSNINMKDVTGFISLYDEQNFINTQGERHWELGEMPASMWGHRMIDCPQREKQKEKSLRQYEGEDESGREKWDHLLDILIDCISYLQHIL